uniref:Protein GAMETE EXPRESSED 1 n=1 Tax=Lygus hesperus TaxID=30085 RepID=A0A0A9W876_LYGHE
MFSCAANITELQTDLQMNTVKRRGKSNATSKPQRDVSLFSFYFPSSFYDNATAVKQAKAKAEKTMKACLQALTDTHYNIFVQYRLHVDVLCAHIAEEVFHEKTHVTVNQLSL